MNRHKRQKTFMETSDSDASLNLTLDFAESVKDLPTFGQFYKFLLVEELALEDNFSELRIGNCAVIGKIYQTEDGAFELENVNLPHAPSELSLPEGTVKISLLDDSICTTSSSPLQNNRYCEACGEVVLINTSEDAEKTNKKLITTYDLHLTLSRLKSAAAREQYLAWLHKSHKVAIKLDFLKEIDNASKLVEYNLALREFYPQD